MESRLRKLTLDNWIQIITSFAVVVGLLLVAYEFRQNTNFAKAEAARSIISDWSDLSISEFESDIFDLYIRSVEAPEGLSSSEVLKMSAWLAATIGEFNLQSQMYTVGLAEDPTSDLVGDFQYYLGSSFARAWYAENRHWLTAHLVEVIDQEMERNPVESISTYVESIRLRIDAEKAKSTAE